MDNKIEAILLFLQDNYAKQFTLKELSEACETNYFYLSSVFKRKVGISFSKYVKSLKIASAKTLLKESLKEIKEIAYELGYKSPNHFYTDFKSCVGMTPMEYRKKNKNIITQKILENLQNILNETK